ncbi:MAG: endonuclease/exonuclease/phosphatase family protein [Bifidobacteriaceae bacterium]|jgi:endonuclease/exonuclease/phosphatase (EEP) superfamily protein YafD|nr:endonuclease/exonuclease/phosphatase family protein [Bifidobacteriaceae bacterium]
MASKDKAAGGGNQQAAQPVTKPIKRPMAPRRPVRGYAFWLLLSLVLLVATLTPLVRLGGPFPIIQALSPLWLILAVLALAWMARLRARVPAAFCLVALLAAVPWQLRLGSPATCASVADGASRGVGGTEFTVLALNQEYSQADPAAVVALAREAHADVLVLTETGAAAVAALDQAGLEGAYPYRTEAVDDNTAGAAVILSNYPFTLEEAAAGTGWPAPAVTLEVGEQAVLLQAVHTRPPMSGLTTGWAQDLGALSRWQQAHPDQALILAGDFNASVVHPAYRGAVRGLDDAAKAGTWRMLPTWPTDRFAVVPFIDIDHIVTRGLAARGWRAVKVAGTDHKAVIATLATCPAA